MGSESDYGFDKAAEDDEATTPGSVPDANEEPQQELVEGAATGDSDVSENSGEGVQDLGDGRKVGNAGVPFTQDEDGTRHYEDYSDKDFPQE